MAFSHGDPSEFSNQGWFIGGIYFPEYIGSSWSANVFVYVLKLLKISIFLSTQVSARMRKLPCRTKAATSHEERFFSHHMIGIGSQVTKRAESFASTSLKAQLGRRENRGPIVFFIMFMTLKLVLHAPMKRSFRLGREENPTCCAGAPRTMEKRSWQSTKQRKSFSVSFATSLKLCNRNRDQKYVKIKRAAKIGLSREKNSEKRRQQVFSRFLYKLSSFVFLSLRFVLCKTVSWRDEPVLINTAIAGMFENNSSVQHNEEQKKLTFSQIFFFYRLFYIFLAIFHIFSVLEPHIDVIQGHLLGVDFAKLCLESTYAREVICTKSLEASGKVLDI